MGHIKFTSGLAFSHINYKFKIKLIDVKLQTLSGLYKLLKFAMHLPDLIFYVIIIKKKNLSEESEVLLYSLKEQFYDAAGQLRNPGEKFYDKEGILREPGEEFFDYLGILRSPGDDFYDSQGILRKSGEYFYDGAGNLCEQ